VHAAGAQTAFRVNSCVALALAERLGGHAGYVAGLVTLSMLLGMASIPLALSALRWRPPP
jgi:hypothetical protein